MYCGNQENLPVNYDLMGSPSQCLQKGVAIGKRRRALQGPPYIRRLFYLLLFLVFAYLFFYYLYTERLFVVERDNGEEEVDWYRFLQLYIPTVVLVGVVMYLLRDRFF